MAYQSIDRENKWVNPASADQLNVMIEDIEDRIYSRPTNKDIPYQNIRHIAVDGCSSNSFLRERVLTLDLTFNDVKQLRLPVSVSGTYVVNASNDNKYVFPVVVKDNVITFPYQPEQNGPYHLYTVIVL